MIDLEVMTIETAPEAAKADLQRVQFPLHHHYVIS